VFQAQVGIHLLQAAVLLFQFLHPLYFTDAHPAIFGFPFVKGCLAEPMLAAETIQPDLILMDIQMPGVDGLEATRHLRANPRFASTPIIALTALAMSGDRERCLLAGANEYMSKPVGLKELTKRIEDLLRTRSGG